MTLDTYMVLERKFMRMINPGDKLCDKCRRNEITTTLETPREFIDEAAAEEELVESVRDASLKLNSTLSALDCSPMKSPESLSNPRLYTQHKLDKIVDKLKTKLVETQNHTSSPVKSQPEKDWADMIRDIKDKMNGATHTEKLRFLTLAPRSWNYQQIMDKFDVSRRMVWLSRNILTTQGILGSPPKKRGKPLSSETLKLILSIYTDQELTRELPGERNTMSIRDDDGNKSYHQKHLLLMNIRELYIP